MMRLRILLLVALVTPSACYTYGPATLESVPDGAHVRALLTPEAERQLLVNFGVQQGRILSGTLEGRMGDQLSLTVPSVPMGTGPGSRPLYQRVMVPAADVLRVDLRRLDPLRTGVVVAAAAAVLGGVIWESLGGGFLGIGGPGDGPQERPQGVGIRISVPWR